MGTDRGLGLGILLTGGNDNGGALGLAFVLAAGSTEDRIDCVPMPTEVSA